MTNELQASVKWQRPVWQMIILALLLLMASSLAMAQQIAQQTDKERKEAEKRTKQQGKEEERLRKEEEKRNKQEANNGCPFTPMRPIPEGKAVIYLYKASYGRDLYPIAANRRVITYLHKGGYFPFITAPGKVEMFMASKNTGSGTFFSNPEIVLDVESGKEYFLELTTRFSAKLHVHAEEKGLKKLQDDRLLLPYWEYEREFRTMEEVYSDPMVKQVRSRYKKNTLMPDSKLLIGLAEQGTNIDVEGEFRGGTLRITRKSGPIKVVIKQYGFAITCSDQGISSI